MNGGAKRVYVRRSVTGSRCAGFTQGRVRHTGSSVRVLAFLLGALTAIVACGVALFLWLRNTKPMGY